MLHVSANQCTPNKGFITSLGVASTTMELPTLRLCRALLRSHVLSTCGCTFKMARCAVNAVDHTWEHHQKTPRHICSTQFNSENSHRQWVSFYKCYFWSIYGQKRIKHICSSPYYPSTNGLAERAVQTSKQCLRQIEGGSVKEKLSRFLFKYRITPHSSTGVAPAELLMGRCLRSRLDLLKPDSSTTEQDHQLKQKLSHDNSKPYRTFSEG